VDGVGVARGVFVKTVAREPHPGFPMRLRFIARDFGDACRLGESRRAAVTVAGIANVDWIC
jgi:hypothetical protein